MARMAVRQALCTGVAHGRRARASHIPPDGLAGDSVTGLR
jgi:hypothetical protein